MNLYVKFSTLFSYLFDPEDGRGKYFPGDGNSYKLDIARCMYKYLTGVHLSLFLASVNIAAEKISTKKND
jgi:hypothetical protein